MLPLFELFNYFSHLNIHSAHLAARAVSFFIEQLGAGSNRSGHEHKGVTAELQRLLRQKPARAVGIAEQLGRALGRPTVTFKIFGHQCLDLWKRSDNTGISHARTDGSLWLRRNFFHRRVWRPMSRPSTLHLLESTWVAPPATRQVSAAKISGGCSGFVNADSTDCKLNLSIPHTLDQLDRDVAGAACLRCLAHGICPHGTRRRPPAVDIGYDEFNALPSVEAKADLVVERLARVDSCCWARRGVSGVLANAATRYHVQDRSPTLREKIGNYAELQAAYDAARRERACGQGAAFFAGGDAAYEQSTREWCMRESVYDLPE